MNKTKSNPLESLLTTQNTSISFGDSTPLPREVEAEKRQGRDRERVFELNRSTSCNFSNENKYHKSSSAACTPEVRTRTKTCIGKPPTNQFSLTNTCPNSEEKENRRVDNVESLGESHASMFYKKRQELKKKHRVASKSIIGIPIPNNHSQSWNNNLNNSKSKDMLKNLSLNQPTRSDPSTFSSQNPLRMSDLHTNSQSNFNLTGRSNMSSSMFGKHIFLSTVKLIF